MKKAIQLGILLVASLLLVSCGSTPEERIADHIEKIGEILEDDPKDGIDELIDYYDDNFSDIIMAVAEVMVEIHESSDKKTTVKKMADEILKAVENIEGPANKFVRKVNQDRDLGRELERKVMRQFREYEDLEEVLEDIGRDFQRSLGYDNRDYRGEEAIY